MTRPDGAVVDALRGMWTHIKRLQPLQATLRARERRAGLGQPRRPSNVRFVGVCRTFGSDRGGSRPEPVVQLRCRKRADLTKAAVRLSDSSVSEHAGHIREGDLPASAQFRSSVNQVPYFPLDRMPFNGGQTGDKAHRHCAFENDPFSRTNMVVAHVPIADELEARSGERLPPSTGAVSRRLAFTSIGDPGERSNPREHSRPAHSR